MSGHPSAGKVVLVAAVADNGVIGADGGIPWRIPADFAHFKRVTVGHCLIFGRTTFEGIGEPLPDRQTIVISTDPTWSHPGVLVCRSFEEALTQARLLRSRWGDDVMVGGGARVYEAAMPYATHQVISRIHLSPPGDTYYPAYDHGDWRETARERHLDDAVPWEIVWLQRHSYDDGDAA